MSVKISLSRISDLTISYLTKINEEKLLLNQSYPVFDCSPSADDITWWMWLLIILLGVGIIGGIGYFIYWFFVLRKKNLDDKDENFVDMNLNASGNEGSIKLEEQKENQAYVQNENGERDSIGDGKNCKSHDHMANIYPVTIFSFKTEIKLFPANIQYFL